METENEKIFLEQGIQELFIIPFKQKKAVRIGDFGIFIYQYYPELKFPNPKQGQDPIIKPARSSFEVLPVSNDEYRPNFEKILEKAGVSIQRIDFDMDLVPKLREICVYDKDGTIVAVFQVRTAKARQGRIISKDGTYETIEIPEATSYRLIENGRRLIETLVKEEVSPFLKADIQSNEGGLSFILI